MRRFLPLLVAATALFLAACGNDDDVSNSKTTSARYAALGASDAYGIGAEPRQNGYVWLIQGWLLTRYDDAPLLNLGIPGATTDVILGEVPLAIAHRPSVVTVWAGVNDIVQGRTAGQFESDLDAILSSLQQGTGARVYVANVPDLTRLPRFQQDPDPDVTLVRVAQWNSIVASRAAVHGAFLVDLYSSSITDPSNVWTDGFHPNNAGHRLIADLFIGLMQGTLPQRRAVGLPLVGPR